MLTLSKTIPEFGLGEESVLDEFRFVIESQSALLNGPTAFAHMDPAPLDIATEITRLNAQTNQNLLHPSLSPFATKAEHTVIEWLCPFFGMAAGHMCSGSTVANLTALWCAREHGASRVVASQDAHLSVKKSAAILGMPFKGICVDADGKLDVSAIDDLTGAALVLTAGSTGRGAIDPLTNSLFQKAAWRHVDAAWAGPLRLTHYTERLAGVEQADSIAISAHKWFFQPKDSAIILFADPASQEPISFSGSYLASANIGVQGSRGAVGVTLLATLLSWGRLGLAERIETCMAAAENLANRLQQDPRTELLRKPETGVVNWRPTQVETSDILQVLDTISSSVEINGQLWLRNVAANPQADIMAIWKKIDASLNY